MSMMTLRCQGAKAELIQLRFQATKKNPCNIIMHFIHRCIFKKKWNINRVWKSQQSKKKFLITPKIESTLICKDMHFIMRWKCQQFSDLLRAQQPHDNQLYITQNEQLLQTRHGKRQKSSHISASFHFLSLGGGESPNQSDACYFWDNLEVFYKNHLNVDMGRYSSAKIQSRIKQSKIAWNPEHKVNPLLCWRPLVVLQLSSGLSPL